MFGESYISKDLHVASNHSCTLISPQLPLVYHANKVYNQLVLSFDKLVLIKMRVHLHIIYACIRGNGVSLDL